MLLRFLDALRAGLFGTFQRMVLSELLRVFLLVLFALAGIFTLLAVLQQIQLGASLGQALRMLPLLIPTSIPWITPPACLFASCVVYGRMANDNEAVALKAAGVDLLSVLRPAMALGLLAAVFTAFLQFGVTPAAWRGSREVLLTDVEESIGLFLKQKQSLEFTDGATLVKLRVRDVREQTVTTDDGQERRERVLVDVVLKRLKKTQDGKPRKEGEEDYEVVARTREAVLRVDLQAGEMVLDNVPNPWQTLTSGGLGTTYSDKPQRVKLPDRFDLDVLRLQNRANPVMVDWPDLPAVAVEADRAAANHRRIARRLAEQSAPQTPDQVMAQSAELGVSADVLLDPKKSAAAQAGHAENETKSNRIALTMRYEYHLRPAIAFGCLFFAVLGCPVGLWANRADYLSIFVICFLPALVVYYPVLFMVGGYSRSGRLPMEVGVWTANAMLGVATIVLSWRLIRR